MDFLNLAFYQFVELEQLPELRASLRSLCAELGLRGTIILSPEGINAALSGPESSMRALLPALAALRPELRGFDVKESRSGSFAFARMLIKIKKEIIPIGRPDVVPSRETGRRISPEELKLWLDEKRDVIVLDTRNEYEIEYGTFERATRLGLRHSRQFSEKLRELSADAREKPVVMFCTGGIRCEKATAVALKEGFREVYQLDGGILRYFERVGAAHYRGSCFVFDERVALEPESVLKGQAPALEPRRDLPA